MHVADSTPPAAVIACLCRVTGSVIFCDRMQAEPCEHSRCHSEYRRHSHPPSVIPAKAGIHPRMARRVSGTQTNRRMDSRLHGNDGKRPPTWHRKLPAPLLSSPHPSSFPRKRESILAWQEGCLVHQPTDGWIPVCTGMTERDPQHGTESCLHPFCHPRTPSVIPAPLVIPAKAGIHPRMARRVSGTPTNRRMDSRLHGNDGKRPPTWHRKLPALLLSFPHPFLSSPHPFLSSPHSFCHSRESGNLSSHGKKSVWYTNRRMDSRLHGNDGKRPPTWHRKLPALLIEYTPHHATNITHTREVNNGRASLWMQSHRH